MFTFQNVVFPDLKRPVNKSGVYKCSKTFSTLKDVGMAEQRNKDCIYAARQGMMAHNSNIMRNSIPIKMYM